MKLHFSFEAPFAYMKEFDFINDYNFLLAHLLDNTLESFSQEYFDFYILPRKYKILDNGCKELKSSIDPDRLLQIAGEIGAGTIIAPDSWRNKKETESLWSAFRERITEDFPFRVMVVPQGATAQEYTESLSMFKEDPKADVIGLAYLTIAKAFQEPLGLERDDDVTTTRLHVLNNVIKPCSKPIHLLGSGFNGGVELQEIQKIEDLYIITCDTSAPFALAIEGVEIPNTGIYPRQVKSLDFNLPFDPEIMELAVNNALMLKRLGEEK